MGKTIVEKIFSSHSGCDAKADDLVIADVDVMMGHDFNGAMTIEVLKELGENIAKPDRTVFVFDHAIPSPNESYSRMQQLIKDFVQKHNLVLYDAGEGICHQLIPEKGYVKPGFLIVGSDSHTCTYGALNAFSTGVGSTDLAVAIKTGKLWFKVPRTIRIEYKGKLSTGIYAKDMALFTIGKLGADGVTYKAVEFYGEVINDLSIEGRLTLCNMVIEMGGKAGIIEADNKTIDWLNDKTIGELKPVYADDDAEYEQTIIIDLNDLQPQVAKPHAVDNTVSVDKVEGTKIHSALIGTCTNGRLEDLRIAAQIIKGRKVFPGVNLFIIPASRKIWHEAMQEGLLEIFLEAGAIIEPPCCGPCSGVCGGVPGDGHNMISTANRNFRGRAGNPLSNIYLASPATVAASAISGVITNPVKFLKDGEIV